MSRNGVPYGNGVFDAGETDLHRQDTDGEGLADPIEAALGTNASYNDSDLDGLLDPIEDRNGDSARQYNETSAAMQDTDFDGLTDGQEDIDHDGIRDANEPDPLNPQSDGDTIPDGVEFDLMHSKDSGWSLTHDTDGDGIPDILDIDADNDGLTDSEEDYNRNATIDITESDPYVNDTDADGLLDGAEPLPFEDTDGDGNINARDNDSNNDSVGDAAQVWIQFRTNATNGQYGAGSWVALIAPKANPYYPDQFDYKASNALYTYSSTVASPAGGVIQDPYGPTAPPPTNVRALQTPEGYFVYASWNAGTSSYDIYVQMSSTASAKYIKSSSAPSDYSDSNRSLQPFIRNNQETYDGRVAVSNDTDFDGVSNAIESNAGMNATNNDTDGDGILDGVEYGGGVDTDHDGVIDAKDTDSDGDGILDGVEDANKNGRLDAGETDRLSTDTDGDGLPDGTEDANRNGVRDAPGGVFNETSPLDRDSDDDGIGDKAEVDGSWCYVDLNGGACTYSANSNQVTDPTKLDTDGDGLSDGLEIGLMSAGVGTDLTKFKADKGPGTHTDPTKADTDGDGLTDGQEDANLDGRTQSNETYGWLWDSDSDGLCDGLSGGKGEDVNKNGLRDQDADGNWTETDPLANDSDVDGILDGQEVNGSWCFAGQIGCTPGVGTDSSRMTSALNADTDGDGLRDGQEVAGWKVGLWREVTMESIRNYTVNSDPKVPDTDADGNPDFVEFQNGSDPRNPDTDGDGFSDWYEVNQSQRGNPMNVTGWYQLPPVIVTFGVTKWAANQSIPGIGGTHYARVKAEIWSVRGIQGWTLNYGQPKLNASATVELEGLVEKVIGGDRGAKDRMNEILAASPVEGQTRSGNGGGAEYLTIIEDFEQSFDENHLKGAWVELKVFNNVSLGARHVEKVKSTLEKIVEFMEAMAKAMAEAASLLVHVIVSGLLWLIGAAVSAFMAALGPLLEAISHHLQTVGEQPMEQYIDAKKDGGPSTPPPSSNGVRNDISALFGVSLLPGMVFIAAGIVLKVFSAPPADDVAKKATAPSLKLLLGGIIAIELGSIFGILELAQAPQSGSQSFFQSLNRPDLAVGWSQTTAVNFMVAVVADVMEIWFPAVLLEDAVAGKEFVALTLSIFAVALEGARALLPADKEWGVALMFLLDGAALAADVAAMITLVAENPLAVLRELGFKSVAGWWAVITGGLALINALATIVSILDHFDANDHPAPGVIHIEKDVAASVVGSVALPLIPIFLLFEAV